MQRLNNADVSSRDTGDSSIAELDILRILVAVMLLMSFGGLAGLRCAMDGTAHGLTLRIVVRMAGINNEDQEARNHGAEGATIGSVEDEARLLIDCFGPFGYVKSRISSLRCLLSLCSSEHFEC